MQYEQIVAEQSWHDYYRRHCVCLGRIVEVIKHGNIRPAYAHDVLPDGGLRVEYENGETEILRGGEISLRLTQF